MSDKNIKNCTVWNDKFIFACLFTVKDKYRENQMKISPSA